MKTPRFVIATLLLSALAATSCTIPYKLKARKWGEDIQKAVKLVQEVGNSAQADPMATQRPEWKSENMPKLDEAKGILNTVKFAIEGAGAPGSLAEAHKNLQTGVNKLIDAITALQDAITFGNPAKAQEFQKLRQEAETALVSARNTLTGGK
jgi:hypothetical protein